MHDTKSHISIPATQMELLRNLIGVSLDIVSADYLHLDITSNEMLMGPQLYVYHELPSGPICLSNLLTQTPESPVCSRLGVSEVSPMKHDGRILLPAWFVVKKIEVWAEKITDLEKGFQHDAIAENTLLISPQSGRNLLIRMDQGGFILTFDEAEIENALDSGRYLIKHIID